ncbi:ATP-binding cassette domain-containing protein [Ornithinimicrobium faecis]|uniref:ATP-binding cassette domain-containing protein n=1 Tax=Ornithinimicrobium faecis TaxID=2934158 RepID=A0ABY4YQE5_9MICO|nr:ATP-binding cassette domain-containing protein [Ornithinimicrobium sp. HY1793]USQ79000.1 ATP-binding cassette domain-containing protein [Ornithinimicrobium sp. HY1793]
MSYTDNTVTDNTTTDETVIEVSGLHKGYGGTEVLQGLDLSLGPGVHALLGPNGAGKTTLVNILTTLVPHDKGTVKVLGMDTRTDAHRIRHRISATGQFAAVDEVLTGRENLVMMARLLGLRPRAARRRADELLTRFDLEQAASRAARTYSGGMRRRLDLAVSLIWPPQALFLDEPTTGLDTRSRLALWEQIRALAAEGTNVFLTTQYLEEADQLADQIAVLDGGRIVANGTAAHLKALVGSDVVRALDAAGTVRREAPTDGTAADLARVTADLAATDPTWRVELHRPTLDDAFLQLTGHAATDAADPTDSATDEHDMILETTR